MQWYEYYVGKWSVGSGKNGLPENWDSCKAKWSMTKPLRWYATDSIRHFNSQAPGTADSTAPSDEMTGGLVLARSL